MAGSGRQTGQPRPLYRHQRISRDAFAKAVRLPYRSLLRRLRNRLYAVREPQGRLPRWTRRLVCFIPRGQRGGGALMPLEFVPPPAEVLSTYQKSLLDFLGPHDPPAMLHHLPVGALDLTALANGASLQDVVPAGCRFLAAWSDGKVTSC